MEVRERVKGGTEIIFRRRCAAVVVAAVNALMGRVKEEEKEEEEEEERCPTGALDDREIEDDEVEETVVPTALLEGRGLWFVGLWTLVGEEGSDVSGEGGGWAELCALLWCILRPAKPTKCLCNPVLLKHMGQSTQRLSGLLLLIDSAWLMTEQVISLWILFICRGR